MALLEKYLSQIEDTNKTYTDILSDREYEGKEFFVITGYLCAIINKYIDTQKMFLSSTTVAINLLEDDFNNDIKKKQDELSGFVTFKENEFAQEINKSKKVLDSEISSIIQERDRKKDEVTQRHNNDIEALHRELQEAEDIFSSVESPETIKFFLGFQKKKYIAEYQMMQTELQNTTTSILLRVQDENTRYGQVIKQIEEAAHDACTEKEKIFKNAKEIKQDIVNKDINEKKEKIDRAILAIQKEKIETVRAEEKKRDEGIIKIEQTFADSYRAFLTNDELIRKLEKTKACKHNFAVFEPATDVPELVTMGSIVNDILYMIKQSEYSLEKHMKIIWDLLENYNESHTIGILQGPILHTSNEGLGIYLDANTKENNSRIRAMVLSLLAQYPAGKLNLVMIDPRTSRSFSEIVNIGDDDKSIVDTKVWTSEDDIQSAINRLNGKLNERVNKYGESTDLCQEKETHIMLCIADFPQNFTIKALSELSIILENGEKYGVSVLIAKNSEEMEQIANNTQINEQVNRIIKRLARIYADENGSFLYSVELAGKKEEFQYVIGEDSILQNADTILRNVYEHIGDLQATTLSIKDVFPNYNAPESWLLDTTLNGFVLPIGSSGKSNITRLIMGNPDAQDIKQHALIEGTTGAGKSILLHAIITSALMKYSPQELQLFLLDYKEAVEFKIYSEYDLPSIRVLSLESDREFGRDVFSMIMMEYKDRGDLFRKAGVDNIKAYREKTKKIVPMLLIIVDEFRLMYGDGSDTISKELFNNILILARDGRAFGIHMIFAYQDMKVPDDIASQMALRFALTGSSNVIDDNSQIQLLQPFHAVFNDKVGEKSNDRIFQVMYPKAEHRDILAQIEKLEKGENYEAFIKIPKKIMYKNFEEYRQHPFNKLMMGDSDSEDSLPEDSQFFLSIGENYSFADRFIINISHQKGDNCLVVTENTSEAVKIIENSIISLIYCQYMDTESENDSFIKVVDFSGKNMFGIKESQMIYKLANKFTNRVQVISKEDSAKEQIPFSSIYSIISEIYDLYTYRLKNRITDANDVFIIVIGIDQSNILLNENSLYEEDIDITMTPITMCKEIINNGAEFGIHIIGTLKDYDAFKELYGDTIGVSFHHRICQKIDNINVMKQIVKLKQGEEFSEGTAIYYNSFRDERVKFRVFDTPSDEWIDLFTKRIAE